jgi:hypothetical protein
MVKFAEAARDVAGVTGAMRDATGVVGAARGRNPGGTASAVQ